MKHPASNPFDLFANWYSLAGQSGIDKPNAMTLSTSGDNGQVSSRMVLLSSFDEQGFVFHTNYKSHKAMQIDKDSRVALLFWWDPIGYQVRIEGRAGKTSAGESDAYFSQRPRGSQIGAWASEQSTVIASRDVLEEQVRELHDRYAGREVPRPPHWGGYRVVPELFEFWINQDSRLHDRFLYKLENLQWQWTRLAP
jgi:pyridoxamine 5'-phosphate oxidase